jgi:hypothetical protein
MSTTTTTTKSKFSLSAFLMDLAEIGPIIIQGVMSLKNEVTGVSKTQLASDSAKLALGVTTALAANDPTVTADAQAASSIIDSVVQSVATSTNQVVQ